MRSTGRGARDLVHTGSTTNDRPATSLYDRADQRAVIQIRGGRRHGNAVGNGGGRASATMIGILGGAILGDNVEGKPQGQLQNVQRCAVQNFYENRTVAYNVVYEYAGKQYAVQMPNDPGPSIQLQVTPWA